MLYKKLQELLLQTGLSETDTLVYLELLRKPAASIWELVIRTGINKSSVYRAFSNLKKIKMVERNENGIYALSLKHIVENLFKQERKFGRLAQRIKSVAPFLHAPEEHVIEFETLDNKEDLREAYIKMAQLPYDTNLDFGDFENCLPSFGDLALAFRFRENRVKHARHHALCTTFGPYTSYFSTRQAAARFKNKVEMANIDFKNRFIIFSDTNDSVFFIDAADKEAPIGILVKSKPIADIQRLNFANFSQKFGN